MRRASMCPIEVPSPSALRQDFVKTPRRIGRTRPVHSAAMSAAPSSPPPRRPGRRLVGGIALAGLVLALLAGCGDDSSDDGGSAPSLKTGVPTVLSEAQLKAFGKAQAFPVYWAGPQADRRYEVTRTAGGRVYVRYLTPDAAVGTDKPLFLTVGTYPGSNAYGALRAVGRREGATSVKTQSGALVVVPSATARNAYFAFPQSNFQVEVYDPQKGRARSLVLDGQISRLS